MKKTFFSELAYFLGIVILATGTALMERADFGLSMIVAPAYIVHLKFSKILTFGMAEYILQALLIIALAIVQRRIKRSYFFSFVTAVIYGLILDVAIATIALVPFEGAFFRVLCFGIGLLLCTLGVSLLVHTYISPEAYELFVKEISIKLNMSFSKFKTIYDCASCIAAISLSFIFFGFGNFVGIKWGTIICTLLNGFLIGKWTGLLERVYEFRDGLPFRKYFE